MRKIVRASVLILTLACAAGAGEIPNNLTVQPTPTPTPPPAGLTVQGAPANADTLPNATAESFGETLLNLLDSLLALF